MLKFLKNNEIDLAKWDECVSRSIQNLIYAMSWYLDIIAPGWCAVVEEVGGRYILVLPFTTKTKLGINYIFQPVFAQQLGVFSLEPESKKAIDAINCMKKKFVHINYHFNSSNNDILEHTHFGPYLKTRITYTLSLNESYQQLTENYASNNKRQIKKALKNGLTVKSSENFKNLISLFRKMKYEEGNEIDPIHYQNLSEIFVVAKSRESYLLYDITDKKGIIVAAGFFLIFQKKIFYVLGASSAEGKEKGAMNLIIDEVVKEYSGGEYLIDFEGGESEASGRFYKDFGGKATAFLSLNYNKLSII